MDWMGAQRRHGQRYGRRGDRPATGEHGDGGPDGRDEGDVGRRRHGGRYVDHGEAAGGAGSDPRGHGGDVPEGAPGDRYGSLHARQGNPRGVGQRGGDSVQGVSGRVGGQHGDRHGRSRSWREAHGYHSEDRFAGATGESARGHRYGSRRGHGTRRRENPEVHGERSG